MFKKIRKGNKPCFVVYDDGQVAWEPLGKPNYRFRWLTDKQPLTTGGYVLLRDAMCSEVCSTTLESLRTVQWEKKGLPTGQNAEGTVHDRHRQQTKNPKGLWIPQLTKGPKGLLSALSNHHLLRDSGGNKKRLCNVHALRSLALTGYTAENEDPEQQQDGDQGAHKDEDPAYFTPWVEENPYAQDAPLSVLIAIQTGSRLRIWVGKRWQILHLNPGDVLAWRGDVLHNGLGYAELNIRVHGYIYPSGYTPNESVVVFDDNDEYDDWHEYDTLRR